MDDLTLTFMPYPHVQHGERRQGITHKWPGRCLKCADRQCERSVSRDVEQCSYGYNFQWLQDDLLIAGIVLREWEASSQGRRRALKEAGPSAVPRSDLAAVLGASRVASEEMQEYLQAARQEVLDEYRESGQFREDMADLLRPSMEQTFAQVHDYRQLISQIIQHVNVYLETTLPGLSLDGQMERTNSNIRSIYWAARLMEFKLLSALFLANPERITDPRSKRVFRFHGAVHKYIQIYKPLMELGNLRLRVFGESRGSLMENPDAIGVIPQAFLDNAIKYAPPGSEIVVTFAEDDDSITLAVQSDGPKILPDEMRRVFEIFFRGSAAKKSGEEGTGFGLGLAQLIADKVDATLSVEQGSQRLDNQAFRTTFSATLPKPVAGESPPSIVNARGRQRGGGRPD